MDIKRFRWADWLHTAADGTAHLTVYDTYRVDNAAENLTETGMYVQALNMLNGVTQRPKGTGWVFGMRLEAPAAALVT